VEDIDTTKGVIIDFINVRNIDPKQSRINSFHKYEISPKEKNIKAQGNAL
jgi:hypothetical protein